MYKISVPIYNERINDKTREKYLVELKAANADRILLVAVGSPEDLELAERVGKEIKTNADFFIENGIEPAIWVGSTIGHGGVLSGADPETYKSTYQPLVNLAGEVIGDTQCPLDKNFRKMMANYVATLAKHGGVKLIFLDDDYRLSQHGKEFCCACELHLAEIRRLCGEDITRKELKKLAFEQKSNKYRTAWLEAQKNSLELLAKEIRAEVDKVDENICVALCSAHSIWGVDGSSAVEISKILAGKNRPVTRLHPAPYWAIHSTMPLPMVFDMARMFAEFSKNSGSELMAEGDTYPRPRHNTPSSYLELFDAVIRADGVYDGTLKYMLDYRASFDYERGYMQRHIRNLPVMNEICEIFDKKTACGVSAPMDKKVMEYADLELGDAYTNNYPLPTAAHMLGELSIPSTYGEGICCALFGETARNYPTEKIEKGAILDAISAILLTESGIDVGLRGKYSIERLGARTLHTSDDTVLLSNKDQNGGFFVSDIDPSCDVVLKVSTTEKGIIPFAYRYTNENGQRFVVLLLDTMTLPRNSTFNRGYYMQALLGEGAEWISRQNLPAKCPKNPELYMLCKKSDDAKKMAVGLFNCYADSILDPVVTLDGEYSKIRFVGCKGKLCGDTVTLDEPINAFEFAAFEVEK